MCVRWVGMCVGGRSGRCVGCCWDIVVLRWWGGGMGDGGGEEIRNSS